MYNLKQIDTTLTLFSTEMRKKLYAKANDKTGWNNLFLIDLINLLIQEMEALAVEISDNNLDGIKREAVDVANFSMMIWDNVNLREN